MQGEKAWKKHTDDTILLRFAKSEYIRDEVTKRQAKQIRKIYVEAYKAIDKELKQLGKQDSLKALQLRRIKALYKDELKKNIQEIIGVINKSILSVGSQVVKDNQKYLGKLKYFRKTKDFDRAYSTVPSEVLKQIQKGAIYNNNDWLLSTALWSDNIEALNQLEKQLQIAIAQNKSAVEIAQGIEYFCNPAERKKWDLGKLYSFKKGSAVEYNSLRLARTVTNHAYQKAYEKVTQKNPFIIGYKWNTAGNHRVCPLCIDLSTKDRFGLGAGIFPKNELPLDHPNGACYISAVMQDLKTQDDILLDYVKGNLDKQTENKINAFLADIKKYSV